MKTKILVAVLMLAMVVPFFSGTSELEAGRSGRVTTTAFVGGLVGGIVGGIIGNSNRSCHRCYERRVVERPIVVERPVYVEPTYVYEAPVVYVPQRRVYQEVHYRSAPVYRESYTIYR